MAAKRPTDALLKELRAFGLQYPGAHTKSPWPGHLDLAVNDKTFAYLSVEGDPLSISCKLPQSGPVALLLPFTKPTGYGLGKSGWVSAEFGDGELPDAAMLKAWIDESYRAQAPKKLLAALAAGGAAPGPKAPTPVRSSRAGSAKPEARAKKATPSTRAQAGGAAKREKAASKAAPTRAAGKSARKAKPANKKPTRAGTKSASR